MGEIRGEHPFRVSSDFLPAWPAHLPAPSSLPLTGCYAQNHYPLVAVGLLVVVGAVRSECGAAFRIEVGGAGTGAGTALSRKLTSFDRPELC